MTFKLILLLGIVACAAATLHAADGKTIFVANCAMCHGTDGKAHTPAGRKLGAKDLSLSKLSDADIGKQITLGTKDAQGNVRMPPFKEKLQPADVSALVAYVKTLRR